VDAAGVAALSIVSSSSVPAASANYSGDATYASSSSTIANITSGTSMQLEMRLSPESITLQSKQQTIATITLVSVNSFADTISLGCAGLPFATSCTFGSDQISLPAGGTQTVQVVIDTAAPLASGEQAANEPVSGSSAKMCILPGAAFLGLMLMGCRRRLRSPVALVLTLFALAVGMSGLSGCAGLTTNGTKPGAYTFQITGVGTKTGISASTNVVMTVTQ
jgi:hypothetical protein